MLAISHCKLVRDMDAYQLSFTCNCCLDAATIAERQGIPLRERWHQCHIRHLFWARASGRCCFQSPTHEIPFHRLPFRFLDAD